MGKKLLSCLLCAVLSAAAVTFAGCDRKPQKTILYLGDSIAEAVLGPSPLSERDFYGYGALVGKCANFRYINRAVSGHQTRHMLEYISRGDEEASDYGKDAKGDDGALMNRTYIKTADIIQISILGNDLLQYQDAGGFMLQVVGGKMDEPLDEQGGKNLSLNDLLETARENFNEIIKKLREYNDDAVILVQTVYNPVFPDSRILKPEAKEKLKASGYDDFDELRGLGDKLIMMLDNIVYEYVKERPKDNIYVVDVKAEFDRITNENPEKGKKLLFTDWVHPSDYGHAVIAEVTLDKLAELGLADARRCLKNYKKIKTEQLKRLYPGVDFKTVRKQINDAKTMEAVTEIYFTATEGLTPDYK